MLKKLIRDPLKLKNFKCTQSDFDKILKKAYKHTEGNVSAWLRYAALNHKPPRYEVTKSSKGPKVPKNDDKQRVISTIEFLKKLITRLSNDGSQSAAESFERELKKLEHQAANRRLV